jgi:hypothetical protein
LFWHFLHQHPQVAVRQPPVKFGPVAWVIKSLLKQLVNISGRQSASVGTNWDSSNQSGFSIEMQLKVNRPQTHQIAFTFPSQLPSFA